MGQIEINKRVREREREREREIGKGKKRKIEKETKSIRVFVNKEICRKETNVERNLGFYEPSQKVSINLCVNLKRL